MFTYSEPLEDDRTTGAPLTSAVAETTSTASLWTAFVLTSATAEGAGCCSNSAFSSSDSLFFFGGPKVVGELGVGTGRIRCFFGFEVLGGTAIAAAGAADDVLAAAGTIEADRRGIAKTGGTAVGCGSDDTFGNGGALALKPALNPLLLPTLLKAAARAAAAACCSFCCCFFNLQCNAHEYKITSTSISLTPTWLSLRPIACGPQPGLHCSTRQGSPPLWWRGAC